MPVIYAFVKIFEKEHHAKDFISGKLFMNTLRYFKEYRDTGGELRGDPYEGLAALYQPSKISLQVAGHIIPPSTITYPIAVHDQPLLDKNAFCIYSLNSGDYESISKETLGEFKRTIELHESCFGLGNYCVVILNAQKFIDRTLTKINRSNISGKLGLVEYFDEHEHHGTFVSEKYGFHKRSFFSHQREYRLLVDTLSSPSGPYTLNIGDLSDIALLTTPDEFKKQLEIMLPDACEA
jgi:hypothetical protein